MTKRRNFINQTDRTFSVLNPVLESNDGNVFKMSTDSMGTIKSQLYSVVFTNIGERIMLPEFGTSIQSMLFEPMNENIFTRIEAELRRAIGRWVPAVELTNVKFLDRIENIENNKMDISIEYKLKLDPDLTDQIQIELTV